MVERSQDYLRLALAAAALLVGGSVAYHYVIYVPEKDHEQQLAEQSKEQAAANEQVAQQNAAQKAASARKANYEVCMSNAQMNYSSRWNALCQKRSAEAEKNRAQCVANGSTEEVCAGYFPPAPANDCLLPHEVSDSYDAMLKDDQKQCLDEARAGILDSASDSIGG